MDKSFGRLQVIGLPLDALLNDMAIRFLSQVRICKKPAMQ
jgi:hypothetical protein